NVQIIGTLGESNKVYPDRELADAIRRAGNVYLAMRFALKPGELAQVRERLEHQPGTTPQQLATQLQIEPSHAGRFWARVKLANQLAHDFTLPRRPADMAGAWKPIQE